MLMVIGGNTKDGYVKKQSLSMWGLQFECIGKLSVEMHPR